MAESQLVCMDDNTVNEKIPETHPRFCYSEEQRKALEELLRKGDGAFKTSLKNDNVKDFLSAREIKWIQETFQKYETDSKEKGASARSKADSGLRSTYWPQLSDIEVPSLDIGWADGARYKGTTRVMVYTHPPKEGEPLIKEVVRKLIQESRKTLAIIMDLLTDLQVLQDLLDVVVRRGVAVYVLLDSKGLPHFLDMCGRLQVNTTHLRNLRVRIVDGWGMSLTKGKLPGSLCNKYMLVDGEKVVFGSYSFTWSSSRLNRTMIVLMTGQVVTFYDQDFREMYAISEEVDLYKEFNIPKTSTSTIGRAAVNYRPPSLRPSTRFQVSLGDPLQVNPQVPAHKYHNPKYLLAMGNTMSSLKPPQDSSKVGDLDNMEKTNLIMQKFLETTEEPEDVEPPPDIAFTEALHHKEASKKDKKHSFGKMFKKTSSRTSVANQSDSSRVPDMAKPPSSSTNYRSMVGNIAEENRNPEQPVSVTGQSKKSSKQSKMNASQHSFTSADDNESKERKRSKKSSCVLS